MQKEPKTEAYLPYYSSQDWACDPNFAVITIDLALADLVVRGISTLKATGFDTIASGRFNVGWDLVSEHEDGVEFGHVSFDPEYAFNAPNVVISDELKFIFPFKHTNDEGWCSMRFEELAGYLDKAWVESYGLAFVQLPTGENGAAGKWLCLDPASEDYFCVECDTLLECIEEAASWLEDTIDPDMEGVVLRPKFDELRVVPDHLRKAA